MTYLYHAVTKNMQSALRRSTADGMMCCILRRLSRKRFMKHCDRLVAVRLVGGSFIG